jgi:hypothetical protein
MAEHIINTKDRDYGGKTFGVKFENGSAVLNDNTVPEHLGRGVDEVADLMKRDFDYDVREGAHAKQAFAVPDLPWKEAKTNVGTSLASWSDAIEGDRLIHDDYGQVTVVKTNKQSVRVEADNGEVLLVRDKELLTKLNTE